MSAIGLGSIRDGILAIAGFTATAWLLARSRATPAPHDPWDDARWRQRPLASAAAMGLITALVAEAVLLLFGNPFSPTVLNPATAGAVGVVFGVQVFRHITRAPE